MLVIRREERLAKVLAPTWMRCRLVALSLLLVAACGCGKSERQKREEQAAADARWEANVAAADAERQKEEQQMTEKEVSRLSAQGADSTPGLTRAVDPSPTGKYLADAQKANPAFLPSGIAVARSGVTKQNMDDASAAVDESLRLRDLDRLKQQKLSGWEDFLGRTAAPVFRDAHWNVAQTAICGEVDFEWSPPDGNQRTRTGFQKFVLGSTVPRTIAWGKKDSVVDFFVGIDVDRRYHAYGQRYDEIMAVTDCTPDLDH